MKLQFLIVFLSAFLTSADFSSEENLISIQDENFEWLLGNWIRLNDENGIITTESWEKSSNGIYTGRGLAMKNNDTVFREDLRILKKNGNWIYEVTGVNADTTNFIIASVSYSSFTAVNPKNPFPKKINYHLENGRLIAEISDDDKRIVFEFKNDQK